MHFVLVCLAACTDTSSLPEPGPRFLGTIDAHPALSSHSTRVTHVVAVSPVDDDVQRVVAPVEDDAFAISVTEGRPWSLAFVDATRRGRRMLAGVLRVGDLDTLDPQFADDIDLGAITIANGVATASASAAELDAALGIASSTADTVGRLDDLATRYANPDIDGDGVLDAEQDHAAQLELHAEYALLVDGRPASADDLVANRAVSYEHAGTGIYGRLPDALPPADRAVASVTFTEPFYGIAGGAVAAPTPAGVPVTSVVFGDSRTFGVYARPGFAVPAGDYVFRSGATSLAFTFVRPPVLDDMALTMHQVMPRVRLVAVDPACVSDCAVSSVEYSWQRRTADGWVALDDEEARVLAPRGRFDLITDAGEVLGFDLTAASGRLPFASAATTGHVVYGNLAFRTRHGMRMAASFGATR